MTQKKAPSQAFWCNKFFCDIFSGSTRRHTVGPGDVEHEQALANPSAVQMNFKFGGDNAPRLPTNIPMMQNQPLHNFTVKNQHLLKLPTVMEASKFYAA